MRLDLLIDHLLHTIARERLLLLRAARYLLPLLLLPIGFALAQMTRGWLSLLAGGVGAMVVLAQIELFLRPILDRARMTDHDISVYLQLAPAHERPNPASAAPLLWPAALAVAVSMALFLPTILFTAAAWQRLLAVALGLGVLMMIWQRLVQAAGVLDRVELRLTIARADLRVGQADKQTSRQGDQMPLSPHLPISPSPRLPHLLFAPSPLHHFSPSPLPPISAFSPSPFAHPSPNYQFANFDVLKPKASFSFVHSPDFLFFASPKN